MPDEIPGPDSEQVVESSAQRLTGKVAEAAEAASRSAWSSAIDKVIESAETQGDYLQHTRSAPVGHGSFFRTKR